MKQPFTLENDLAMLMDLLAEMVDNKNLTQTQMEQILEKVFAKCNVEIPQSLPSDNVVNNIMNYSKALKVLNPGSNAPYSMIIN
ncbi:MAG: hypothetical protein ACOCXV_02300 [Bacteroidota bacterium]